MTLKFTKLSSCNDMHTFTGFRLKLGVPNICPPRFKTIEFSKKHKHTEAAQRHNTRVDALQWNLSQVAISNHLSLVAPIMLAFIDEVCADLLEATRRISFVAAIPEGIIFMELG